MDFFHVCLGYATFCKYLIGLRDNISAQCACIWYAYDMKWGGGEGGLAQYFAKTEVGNSLCILAFLQETDVIFWDIKGLFVVSSVTENENINTAKITFFLYKWHLFFDFYACPLKKNLYTSLIFSVDLSLPAVYPV